MLISRRLFVLGLLPSGALAHGLVLKPRAQFPRDHGAHPGLCCKTPAALTASEHD
jgi:hypothetical protein